MSAQPCGCDPEAAWICKRHLEERERERALAGVRHGGAWLAAESEYAKTGSVNGAVDRFKQRLADADAMRDTIDTPAVRIVTAAVDLLAERHRIAQVLATFYRAELSMSSVQPLLALAVELNPDLVERAR